MATHKTSLPPSRREADEGKSKRSHENSEHANIGKPEHAFQFTTIDSPGAQATSGFAINNMGEIAGVSFGSKISVGFLYDHGTFTTADTNAGVSIAGINARGAVIGTVFPHFFDHRGFLYNNGVLTEFDLGPHTKSGGNSPTGINNSGEVVGYYDDVAGKLHGFVYDKGVLATLDVPGAAGSQAQGINDRGTIVGSYDDGKLATHGFIYNGQAFTTLDAPGAIRTTALKINNAGEILGAYDNASGPHTYIYDDGAFTTIDVPGATTTTPTGLNRHGEIVGNFTDALGSHGFIYDDGAYTTIDAPGAASTKAYGINDAGEVVGEFQDSAGVTHAFTATGHEADAHVHLQDLLAGQMDARDFLPEAWLGRDRSGPAANGSGRQDNDPDVRFAAAYSSSAHQAMHAIRDGGE
jgi:probable HAF family extracellular repeat protein